MYSTYGIVLYFYKYGYMLISMQSFQHRWVPSPALGYCNITPRRHLINSLRYAWSNRGHNHQRRPLLCPDVVRVPASSLS